jgi:hypothetical protein
MFEREMSARVPDLYSRGRFAYATRSTAPDEPERLWPGLSWPTGG